MRKRELQNMLPKDKFDVMAVQKLENLEKEELQLIFPEIIFWMSDANWPVAEPIVEILLKYPSILLPYLEKILSMYETDDELKYNSIMLLLPRLSMEIQRKLSTHVRRICEEPTENEIDGSYEIAQSYMKNMRDNN